MVFKKIVGFLFISVVFATQTINAQSVTSKKPQMKFLGAYDAGLPNVSIIKLLDPTDDVLCYVLMPDTSSRKQVDKDKWTYEANTVGSISCLKVMVPVMPIAPNRQTKPVQ